MDNSGRNTQFGFDWGNLRVTRIACDPKFGYVVGIASKHGVVEVRVTPKGYIRVGPTTRMAKGKGYEKGKF